jgi:pimeloyl-ACP methyl ester carboxylesterase
MLSRTGHVAWQLFGERPRILLLHGMSDSAACWDTLIPFFTSYGGVLATDARGHGRSDLPAEPVGEAVLAADAAMVLDELGTGPVIVIGHSMGAMTAAHLSRLRPDVVSAAVLEDPPTSGRQPPQTGYPMPDWLADLRDLDPQATIDRGRRDNPAWSADEFPPWATSKHEFDPDFFTRLTVGTPALADVLAGVSCPVLLLYGDSERGGLVTAEAAAECEQKAGGPFTATHIGGVGHNVHREARNRYVAVVGDFIDSVRQ